MIRTLPIDVQKGQAVELVLLTEKGKESKLMQIPHTVTRKVREEITAERIKEKLKQYEGKIEIAEKPYARTGRAAVQISGNREDLIAICKKHSVHFDEISVPQLLRWKTNFPYAILDDNNNFMRKATLEELLALPDAALDIETKKIITKEEDLDDPDIPYSQIKAALYAQRLGEGGYAVDIFTTPDTDPAEIQEALEKLKLIGPNLQKLKSWTLHPFENWEHITPALAECMRNSQAVYVHGHNLMAFDLLELRDKPDEEEFTPAIDESEPKITAHAGFGKRVEVKGFWIFDHYGLSRFYIPFLPDKRAETVCNFFDAPYEKLIKDYRTLGFKIWKGECGDKKAAAEVLAYATGDVIASLELGQTLKRIGLILSRAFETSLESVCAVSPKMLGKNFWDKRTYEQTNTFNFSKASLDFRKYDALKVKLNALKLPEKFTKGVINDREIYAIYFNPIPEVFTVLKSDETASELIKASEDAKGPEKFIYLRAIDALGEFPMYDLKKVLMGQLDRTVFFAKYKINPEEANSRFNKVIESTLNFLRENNAEILNYTDDLLLISGKNLESKFPGWLPVIGKVNSLYSQDLGVYVANMDGKLIAQGIDIRCKRGYAIEKEKELVSKFFELLLLQNNKAGALDLVYNELCKPLNESVIAKESLLIKIKPGKDASDYSKKSQNGFRVWAINKLGLKKGKEYYIGFGLDQNLNPDVYLKADFLKQKIKIDMPRYQTWLFEEGKLQYVLETICNPSRADDCSRLQHFMRGQASQAELESLKQPVAPYVQKPSCQANLKNW